MQRLPVRNRTGIFVLIPDQDVKRLTNQRIYQDFAGTFWVQNMLKSRTKLAELVPDFGVESAIR